MPSGAMALRLLPISSITSATTPAVSCNHQKVNVAKPCVYLQKYEYI